MAEQKFLPINVRIRIIEPELARSGPTLMCCVPSEDPLKAASGVMRTLPCHLEIMLNDPDTGKDDWYAVPFAFPPPPSVIEAGIPYKRKTNE